MSSPAQRFFATHPVFTLQEFEDSRIDSPRAAAVAQALLAHHVGSGRLLRIRRGLYASVPFGADAASFTVDPWLVAARLTDDAILAYHTALEFQGKAHSPHTRCVYLTRRGSRPLRFQGHQFVRAKFPSSLRTEAARRFDVVLLERGGLTARVTSLERTLVDVLDRPDLGGDWEEVWRSLESVEYFDLDRVIRYALLLKNATVVAKVGFFLEQHRERLMVDEKHLRRLRPRRPKEPHYLARSKREPGRLVRGWNLIVPPAVLGQSWRDVS